MLGYSVFINASKHTKIKIKLQMQQATEMQI
jgi:hypothetical protein